MNREEQIENSEDIQEYLQRNNIHAVFNQLVQQIALQKPKHLLDFIIEQLQISEKFTLFVVGPPGLSINALIPQAVQDNQHNFQLFNFGQEVAAIQATLPQQHQQSFKSCKLVKNEAVDSIIEKLEKLTKSDKSYIIEGFPKNLSQALTLQKRGIYAKNILIVNVHTEGLTQLCSSKVETLNPDMDMFSKSDLVRQAALEHEINISEIKSFYKNYREIDISRSHQSEYITKQLKKAFSIQTLQPTPRIATQIIILGAPCSGRTTLGKRIAQHYNLIYISTSILIAEEVRRDTIHGRKIKSSYINNELIDNFLMEKLIEERIAKKDCKMQGFVLEGYPKKKEQLDNIKNMKLEPTMIVAIDLPKEVSQHRSDNGPIQLGNRYENWKALEVLLRESKEKVFWIDPLLSVGNMYEEVLHELEKGFI